jgi:RNA polymerase sigma-70 factor (ECF subfamily)
LGVPANAVDDAAQRVFWIAAKNLHRIAPASERSYLFGTSVRVASDARRVHGRVREVGGEAEIESTAHPAPSPDELLDQKRAREILDSMLEDMPMELRTVLVLVEGEGLTGSEVASLLEIPEGTVNSRLRRAREALNRNVARLTKRAKNERGLGS